MGHKRNVAIALTDRAVAFSNPTDRPQSLKNVRKLLKDNGYPRDFVENIIKQRVNRFYNNGSSTERHNEDRKRYLSTPYIPGLSERIGKVLKKHNMILSTKTTNKVQNVFTRTKYSLLKKNRCKMVYRVRCKQCSAVYIGETKQKVNSS